MPRRPRLREHVRATSDASTAAPLSRGRERERERGRERERERERERQRQRQRDDSAEQPRKNLDQDSEE
jgi:hypothetical protein